jgi:hypothetical protein
MDNFLAGFGADGATGQFALAFAAFAWAAARAFAST